MNKKYLVIGMVVAVFMAVLAWLFIESSKPPPPLPGTKIDDLGRSHITNIQGVAYNSNPPTSGPHFPVWAKKGVYDRVLSDGHLIHSLEHGYIIISYNCGEGISNASTQEATDSAKPLTQMKISLSGEMSAFTPQNPPEVEVELPQSFNAAECSVLVDQLEGFLNDFQRVIVVPRPNLDTRIALTAWTRIEKLDSFDKDRIKEFIEAFHNKGPEKTAE